MTPLETCSFPEPFDSAVALFELESDARGGIGSVKILAESRPGVGYQGATCVSAKSFPIDAAPKYRLRIRFLP